MKERLGIYFPASNVHLDDLPSIFYSIGSRLQSATLLKLAELSASSQSGPLSVVGLRRPRNKEQ